MINFSLFLVVKIKKITMKNNVPHKSTEEIIEDMLRKNEGLLLTYTVDELIDMALNGREINIDGCFSPPSQSSPEGLY